jgi:hypothetical protein
MIRASLPSVNVGGFTPMADATEFITWCALVTCAGGLNSMSLGVSHAAATVSSMTPMPVFVVVVSCGSLKVLPSIPTNQPGSRRGGHRNARLGAAHGVAGEVVGERAGDVDARRGGRVRPVTARRTSVR